MITLAAVIIFVVTALLVWRWIADSTRMLSSRELSLEQTRISLEVFIRQTELARTSEAGLYLTLGVPFPTATPFIVPTSGALGRPTAAPPPAGTPPSGAVSSPPPGTQPGQLPATATPTRTPTLAPGQPTHTLTFTPSPTTAAPPPTGWGGEWTVYFGGDWEDLRIGKVNVTVSGRSLTGSGTVDGDNLSLTGQLTEDGQQVYGQYILDGTPGEFFWQQGEPGQFGGNMKGNLRFCGSRAGLPQPETCGIYFLQ